MGLACTFAIKQPGTCFELWATAATLTGIEIAADSDFSREAIGTGVAEGWGAVSYVLGYLGKVSSISKMSFPGPSRNAAFTPHGLSCGSCTATAPLAMASR